LARRALRHTNFEPVMPPVRRLSEPDRGRTNLHRFDNAPGGLLKSINKPPT
jgi:hypothetical protein